MSVKNLLFVDFETAYDSKNKYDLRKMSVLEYVRDPRFNIQGMGFCWENTKPEWVSGEHDIADTLAPIDWSDTAIVAHNIKFDGFILKEKFGIQPKMWIDTKGMAKAVLGKSVTSVSLAKLAQHYGFVSKGTLKTDGIKELTSQQEKELAEYCMHDVELCKQIYQKLILGFPADELPFLSMTVDMFVNPQLILNTALLQQTAVAEYEEKKQKLDNLGLPKTIFASNPKFAELLRKEGYIVPMKVSPRTKKQIPALALGDPEFLEMADSEDPILKTLCEARIAVKSTLMETRSIKLAKIGATGKWGFDVDYSGAKQTHRLSGGKNAGGNPQNFTRNSPLREAVQAPEGHKLIVGDFANIELRLQAYLANDPGMIEAIENDRDIYSDFASTFYGRPITKADKAERQFGKCAVLGLGYGMGATKFQRTALLQTGQKISMEEAKKAVTLYRWKYGQIPALWDRLHLEISSMTIDAKGRYCGLDAIHFEKNALILPSGLKMRYPNLRWDNKEWIYDTYEKLVDRTEQKKLYGGKILENICQGLAGELCKEAAIVFFPNVTGLVHDEIHLLVPDRLASEYMLLLKSQMEKSPKWLPKMKLKAEVGMGQTWAGSK